MIKQFIYDMIHMTEGEKLVYYWPLWVTLIVISLAYFTAVKRKWK